MASRGVGSLSAAMESMRRDNEGRLFLMVVFRENDSSGGSAESAAVSCGVVETETGGGSPASLF